MVCNCVCLRLFVLCGQVYHKWSVFRCSSTPSTLQSLRFLLLLESPCWAVKKNSRRSALDETRHIDMMRVTVSWIFCGRSCFVVFQGIDPKQWPFETKLSFKTISVDLFETPTISTRLTGSLIVNRKFRVSIFWFSSRVAHLMTLMLVQGVPWFQHIFCPLWRLCPTYKHFFSDIVNLLEAFFDILSRSASEISFRKQNLIGLLCSTKSANNKRSIKGFISIIFRNVGESEKQRYKNATNKQIGARLNKANADQFMPGKKDWRAFYMIYF